MINSISFSKIYGIKILDLYGGEVHNCIVIGTTNIDNVSNNEDDYNIYETFFQPVGLGLTSYYTAIKNDTVIYICKKVESLEPLTISDEKIFIPTTLIDYDNSIEYVECTNFNFNIYPVIRRFVSENERESYIKEIREKMTKTLKRLIDFSVLDNEIDIAYSPIYLSTEDIDAIENKRTKAFDDYKRTISSKQQFDREREKAYNTSISNYNSSRIDYEKKIKEYNTKLERLEFLINEYEKKLEN
jgi:hypothetical protein